MENALQDNRAGNIKFQVLSSFTLVTNNKGLCFEVKRHSRTSNYQKRSQKNCSGLKSEQQNERLL